MGFIFQVRLPRNQLYVLRVSPKTRIEQILDQVCKEKGFDPRKHEVRKIGKKSNFCIFDNKKTRLVAKYQQNLSNFEAY